MYLCACAFKFISVLIIYRRRDAYNDDGDNDDDAKNAAFCSADCDETSSRLRNTQTSVIVVTKIISTKSTEKCVCGTRTQHQCLCACVSARTHLCMCLNLSVVYVCVCVQRSDANVGSAAALCVCIHQSTCTNTYTVRAKRNTKYIDSYRSHRHRRRCRCSRCSNNGYDVDAATRACNEHFAELLRCQHHCLLILLLLLLPLLLLFTTAHLATPLSLLLSTN